MREAMAITGYVPEGEVEGLTSAGTIDVRPERDIDTVLMQIQGKDVESVRVGSAEGGLTLVQLILRDGAEVRSVTVTRTDAEGMRAFHDPVLNRITQEATAKKIMI